MHTIGLFW